jgi:tetratricopeptide (TPR) repeat protein/DNA-binding SARP family transcriptional activator
MEFRTLGPIELWSAGHQQDLGPARTRCLLAILLLAPRTIVPAETLIDRLWDGQPPPKARQSLSAYITRLRASLRQAVGDGAQLAGRAGGYVLDVGPETVDVHQFRRLRQQAGGLATSGDYDRAATRLLEANGLWHGQALAGIRGDWIARMRDSLEEERRAAILERIGYELELGRHAELIGELRHLLAEYPLDERLVARQMTALYRSGRSADALSLYRDTRSRLVDEQGTEPGPMLSELHQRILVREPGLAVLPPGQHPGRAPPADTLPPETAEFVGRRKELELLTGEYGSTPGIAIIEGMPGVGKTALAIRAARLVSGQYPDGMLYLNLHPGDPGSRPLDPAEALQRLLRMMSVPATQIPETISGRAALWRAQLSRRRAIVILDDAAKPDQLRPLLAAFSRCLILITTRRRLTDFVGARTLTLDVLATGDAITLFRQIAGADLAPDTDQVAEAVTLCGRLPLAIQLTASRVAQNHRLGLAGLIEELSQSPALLGGTSAACPKVMAAFEVSYQALEAGHQRFFRRLGASPCASVSLQAAAALDGCTPAEAGKALATLLDYHLLSRAPGGQFRFHDLIRGYAAVRAGRDDPKAEQRQAGGRLLGYYLHTADQADRVLHPLRHRLPVRVAQPPAASPPVSTQEDAASWLESEWRNILQAAQYAGRHAWQAECADLTHVLADFMEIRGYWDEAIAAHTRALQACGDLTDPARIAQASLALSAVHQQTGHHEAARELADEAAAIYRSLGDTRGEAEALDQLGLAHQRTARSREALAYFSEARLRYVDAADERGVASTLSHSGIACWHLGRYAQATAHLRDALARYREAGDRRGEAKTLNNLGRTHHHSGRHAEALDAYTRSLQIFREIGGAQNEAILCHNIGTVHHANGSFGEALAACRRALAIYRSIGDLPDEADVLNDIGAIYSSAACYDEARAHHGKARRIAEEIKNLSQQVVALRNIADICRCLGEHSAAFKHYDEALRLAREIGDLYEEGKIIEGIAESTLSTQRPAAARIAFRQALDIFEQLGLPEAESARVRMETINPAAGLRIS